MQLQVIALGVLVHRALRRSSVYRSAEHTREEPLVRTRVSRALELTFARAPSAGIAIDPAARSTSKAAPARRAFG